eukprot:2883709-Rhodomonas_salina.2
MKRANRIGQLGVQKWDELVFSCRRGVAPLFDAAGAVSNGSLTLVSNEFTTELKSLTVEVFGGRFSTLGTRGT